MTGKALTICLWFDTEGEEAANYYTRIFPGSRIGRVSRYTDAGPGPAGTAMVVEFELAGQKFVALNGGPANAHFTEAISFQIPCADQDEVDYYWDRLVDGGQESQCGWLKDRFGLSWQIVPDRLFELLNDPDPARAVAATKAMLGMRKIVISELEAAADAA